MEKVKTEPMRIKISQRDDLIDKELLSIKYAIEVFENLTEHLNDVHIEMPNKIKLSMAKVGTESEDVQKWVRNEFKGLHKRLAESEIKRMFKDLSDWDRPRALSLPNWEYVEIKNGKIKPIAGIEDEIREKYTYYLDDPVAIELCNRYRAWVEEGDYLYNELRAINNTYFLKNPFCMFFAKEGGGMVSAEGNLNFSKSLLINKNK